MAEGRRRTLTGMEAYASTMASRGQTERRRLKPGMKLADGSTYTGDYQTTVKIQKRERLLKQITELQVELVKLDEELGIVEESPEGDEQEVTEEAPQEQPAADTKSTKKRGKGVSSKSDE